MSFKCIKKLFLPQDRITMGNLRSYSGGKTYQLVKTVCELASKIQLAFPQSLLEDNVQLGSGNDRNYRPPIREVYARRNLRKVEALRQLGVPQGFISFLVTNFPSMAYMKHQRFVEAVETAKEMGFDPLKSFFEVKFCLELQVLAKMPEAMWKSKLKKKVKNNHHQLTIVKF
ncbi:hypothetical protein CR513_60431, partial [Mucuna pruriens]